MAKSDGWPKPLKRDDRNAACSLFWTLGGNQVGRTAISGWREVLTPLLRSHRTRTHIWPFDGKFHLPVSSGDVFVVETYPADACVQVGLRISRGKWSKRRQTDRQSQAATLLRWAEQASIKLDDDLRDQISMVLATRALVRIALTPQSVYLGCSR